MIKLDMIQIVELTAAVLICDNVIETRKLCYRKGDRALRAI